MPGNSLLEHRTKSDSCWSLKPPSFRLRRGGGTGREEEAAQQECSQRLCEPLRAPAYGATTLPTFKT